MLEPALRQRAGARDGRADRRAMRDAAYDASVELARERGAVPALQRRPVPLAAAPSRRACRQALKERIRAHGTAQLAPAVDRADRHHQPGLRRQREQRHRAGVQLELHAQEARARRQLQGVRGRRPCVAPVPAPEGRGRAADAGLRHRARDERAGARRDGGRGGALRRHRDLARPSTCRPTIRTTTSSTSTCRPGSSGLKGLATYRPNARARRGAERRAAAGAAAARATPNRRLALDRLPARRCWPRCAGRAGPSCRPATRPGPT